MDHASVVVGHAVGLVEQLPGEAFVVDTFRAVVVVVQARLVTAGLIGDARERVAGLEERLEAEISTGQPPAVAA